jgi:hypothetical protein
VKLPQSFRAYLLGFAGGLMFGYEMDGIPTERARIPPLPPELNLPHNDANAIMSIVKSNKKIQRYFPPGYVQICSDGGDFFFYLCTSEMSATGECPVIMCGPGADGIQVADNFLEFLEHLTHRVSFGPKKKR